MAHRVGGALTCLYDRSVTSRITANTPGVFAQTFSVPEDAIDELGHVSNLKYLAWMQDIAIQHSTARAWPVERYLKSGAVWVVRSHFITYIRPAFAGETITLLTWVAEMRQRSSSRRYLSQRANDQQVLVEAETVWVYVDRQSGRPRKIPDDLRAAFLVVPLTSKNHALR
jgi:acyl-CoA thioester hydrolase